MRNGRGCCIQLTDLVSLPGLPALPANFPKRTLISGDWSIWNSPGNEFKTYFVVLPYKFRMVSYDLTHTLMVGGYSEFEERESTLSLLQGDKIIVKPFEAETR